MQIKLSESTAARRRIVFFAMDDDSADGFAPKTGLSFSTTEVQLSKNGAAEVDSAGTVTEIGGGSYYYEATAAELDTVGSFVVRPAKTDVYTMPAVVQIVSFDPYDAADLGLTNLDAVISTRLASADYDAPETMLDYAAGVETGLTVKQALRLICSVLVGRLSGAGTGTEVFRNAVADSKARVTATVDSSGNRSAITTDLT